MMYHTQSPKAWPQNFTYNIGSTSRSHNILPSISILDNTIIESLSILQKDTTVIEKLKWYFQIDMELLKPKMDIVTFPVKY